LNDLALFTIRQNWLELLYVEISGVVAALPKAVIVIYNNVKNFAEAVIRVMAKSMDANLRLEIFTTIKYTLFKSVSIFISLTLIHIK
jgi:hypothetical protein